MFPKWAPVWGKHHFKKYQVATLTRNHTHCGGLPSSFVFAYAFASVSASDIASASAPVFASAFAFALQFAFTLILRLLLLFAFAVFAFVLRCADAYVCCAYDYAAVYTQNFCNTRLGSTVATGNVPVKCGSDPSCRRS